MLGWENWFRKLKTISTTYYSNPTHGDNGDNFR